MDRSSQGAVPVIFSNGDETVHIEEEVHVAYSESVAIKNSSFRALTAMY